jgi:putative two-component system response regulator
MTDLSRIVIAHRPHTVLVVDNDERSASFFQGIFGNAGYDVHVAVDGPSALAWVAAAPPDVIVMEVRLPGPMDGVAVCRGLRSDVRTRLTPVVLVTASVGREHRLASIEAGADDLLSKPVDCDELLARVRSLIRLKEYTDDLDSAASILMTLGSMIEARDGHSEGHCHRMANYAMRLGRSLGMGQGDLQALYRGGFLHDIGMLAIPDSVLRKAGPLDPDEYELVKSHTTIGDELCANLRSLSSVRPIVRHHHERLDGSGYPDGLRGDEVPLIAQIVGIADVYEGVTTQAPYQAAQSADRAIDVLRTHVERGWRSRDLVEQFIALVGDEQFHAGAGAAGHSTAR